MSNMDHQNITPTERGKKEEARPTFFLDSFPSEVLDNVVRFLSLMPNAKFWEPYVDLFQLEELFAVRGELGSFIKSRFDTLCVSSTVDLRWEYKILGWKDRYGPNLWTNNIHAARKYVLAGGGEYLTTLVIRIGHDEIEKGGDQLINDFRTHCPNLKSLSIMDKDSSWVNAFGKQLEKVEFSTVQLGHPHQRPTILGGLTSRDLRELTLYTLGNCDFPEDLWQKIGSSLEKLTLYGVSSGRGEVAKIEKHCRNLKSIYLQETGPEIVSFLCSYGDQLEYAFSLYMTEDELMTVAEACPNAALGLAKAHSNLQLHHLKMFGPKLESLTIRDSMLTGDVDEWKHAWDKCANIRTLSIKNWKVSDMEIIFSTPKVGLKELDLSFHDGIDPDDVKKTMVACAKGTKCVEKFKYSGPALKGDAAKLFFEKNRASLTVIDLDTGFQQEGEDLNELRNMLHKLPALEVVRINCTPNDSLLALTTRGVICTLYSQYFLVQ